MNRSQIKVKLSAAELRDENNVQVLKDMVELQQELIASLIKEVYRLSDELQSFSPKIRKQQMPAQRHRPGNHLAS